MAKSTRSIDFDEPPVVGAALRREQVPEPIDLRIDDQLLILVPESARDLWIEPCVEDLARRRRDRPLELDFHGLRRRPRHFFFAFLCFLSAKWRSNRSRRSFQKRS